MQTKSVCNLESGAVELEQLDDPVVDEVDGSIDRSDSNGSGDRFLQLHEVVCHDMSPCPSRSTADLGDSTGRGGGTPDPDGSAPRLSFRSRSDDDSTVQKGDARVRDRSPANPVEDIGEFRVVLLPHRLGEFPHREDFGTANQLTQEAKILQRKQTRSRLGRKPDCSTEASAGIPVHEQRTWQRWDSR